MEEIPLTCPSCGHTSLWNTFSDGCPICRKDQEEEIYEETE